MALAQVNNWTKLTPIVVCNAAAGSMHDQASTWRAAGVKLSRCCVPEPAASFPSSASASNLTSIAVSATSLPGRSRKY
eukprot:1161729-Pelagomonas_calceolata.AAC.18